MKDCYYLHYYSKHIEQYCYETFWFSETYTETQVLRMAIELGELHYNATGNEYIIYYGDKTTPVESDKIEEAKKISSPRKYVL